MQSYDDYTIDRDLYHPDFSYFSVFLETGLDQELGHRQDYRLKTGWWVGTGGETNMSYVHFQPQKELTDCANCMTPDVASAGGSDLIIVLGLHPPPPHPSGNGNGGGKCHADSSLLAACLKEGGASAKKCNLSKSDM